MNVWMKRGLQTALFTGGLLAAGSGTASADDAIGVTVPVTVTDNAVAVLGTSPGTTAPEITLPVLAGTVRADLGAASVSVPVTVAGNSADVAGLDVAQPAAAPAPAGQDGAGVDVDAPVTVTGNAVAALGNATAAGSPRPSSDADSQASIAHVDAPVTVCGNGVGVLGDATATCTTPAATGGAGTPAAPVTVDMGADVGADVGGSVRPVRSDETAGGTPAGSDCGIPLVTTGPGTTGTTGSVNGRVGGTAILRTATPAAASAATSAGATSTSADRTPGSGSVLASTGSDLVPLALGGLLALLLGLGLTIRARRGVVLS